MNIPAPLQPRDELPIARYRFVARAHRSLPLPEYAGSLLRGVFGAALRQITCLTGQKTCPNCPLYVRCPYPAIFETPPQATSLRQQFSQAPCPYVIEPPPLDTPAIPAGQTLEFHMVLIGTETLRQLPLIIRAWRIALEHGLGSRRAPLQLERVQWCRPHQQFHDVWTHASNQVAPHPAMLPIHTLPQGCRTLRLHITTPLRLQRQGTPLRPHELSARALLLAALRRASLMLELHLHRPAPPDATSVLSLLPHIEEDRTALHWRDWSRYSSRQKQEMTLGGAIGAWTLHAPAWDDIWPWLWLGQWLHLGKNATMGMGAYRLEMEPCFE
ncbi:CRISPR system precrRNA processing endoribonuclease RAMP protein Cas6 [Tepidicella xavieri]|uniref:Uncharacterized protein DUF2276 n=1 Tax=Tepidicella xavieri TaxID=360241 RepID=A0A4R6UE35_9BURK|nr:CRISPR system precrRNA processing endoribonuclease RAMP protein Cas6 [Tepidicella xavieri]TDQ44382.1 uncharacterized protein DUF2276 [Tepidicella xavieri]